MIAVSGTIHTLIPRISKAICLSKLFIFFTFIPTSQAKVYDLKKNGDFLFEACGSKGVRISKLSPDGKTLHQSILPIKALALSIAYDRLYVAQGNLGIKELDLNEAKNFKTGKKIQYTGKVLNFLAEGIAIDEKRQVLFTSGVDQSGSSVTAWHFPDPRQMKMPVHPLSPIVSAHLDGSGGMQWDSQTHTLFVASGVYGIAAFRFDFTNLHAPQVNRIGNALPFENSHNDWNGIDIDLNGAVTAISYNGSRENITGRALAPTEKTELQIYKTNTRRLLHSIALRTYAAQQQQERYLNEWSTRKTIFLAKFGEGFFGFLPIAHYGEALYTGDMEEMYSEGLLSSSQLSQLKQSLKLQEGASKIGGVVASTLLTIWATGGMGGLASIRGAVAAGEGRGLMGVFPALVRFVGGPGQVGKIALDVSISNGTTLVADLLQKRPANLIVRDLLFSTVFSTMVSCVGLSPNLTRFQKMKLLATNSAIASHITVNLSNGDARDYNSFMTYNVLFAATPFVPVTSLTRYELVNTILGFFKSHSAQLATSKALPVLGKLLANEKVVIASVLAGNQVIAAYSYVKGDQIMRSHIYENGKIEHSLERGPFRVNFRMGKN